MLAFKFTHQFDNGIPANVLKTNRSFPTFANVVQTLGRTLLFLIFVISFNKFVLNASIAIVISDPNSIDSFLKQTKLVRKGDFFVYV